jgi:hypothetical protein
MENIQEKMKELFGGSCYAYCLEYLFGNQRTLKGLTNAVLQDWVAGFIDDDGYVSKPLSIVETYVGAQYKDIKKPLIEKLEDLPDGLWIVEYRWGTKQHFVVANRDGIIFDPSGDSNTVKNGKPVTYRLFIK